jgi:hypothetical protein
MTGECLYEFIMISDEDLGESPLHCALSDGGGQLPTASKVYTGVFIDLGLSEDDKSGVSTAQPGSGAKLQSHLPALTPASLP